MKPRLLLEAEARQDLVAAFDWYEAQRSGLGSEFLAEVAFVLEAIEASPERFPVIRAKTHRALVRRFPYGIFYIIESDLIAVIACMHGRRDPQRWQIRK
jgi:plasmid stabilization system protein ParE